MIYRTLRPPAHRHAARLIDPAKVLVGWIRGGLALVDILASTMLGCTSGSSVADAASVGSTLFVGCASGKLTMEEVSKEPWPFSGAMCLALLVVTYVPALSLWLPRTFGL